MAALLTTAGLIATATVVGSDPAGAAAAKHAPASAATVVVSHQAGAMRPADWWWP